MTSHESLMMSIGKSGNIIEKNYVLLQMITVLEEIRGVLENIVK